MRINNLYVDTQQPNHITQAPQISDNVRNFLETVARERWTLADLEKAYIYSVLEITGGNRKQAAKILGLSRSSLYNKVGSSLNLK